MTLIGNRRPSADRPPSASYQEILSSTAWIGGSSVINVGIGVIRTKAMAMLLGPAGFGLMGMLTSIADLTRSIAEMGLNSAGVRQIAEASSSGDRDRIARTVAVLRLTALGLGTVGAAMLLTLAAPVANLTFGDYVHTSAVALVSLAVFFRLVSDAQGALLQGLRRVADVAKVNVLSALIGTVASVPLVYWLREEGVALALVIVAATAAAASWWYSRKLQIASPSSLTMTEAKQEVKALLSLGVALMVSGMLTMGAAYVVRLLLVQDHGLEDAGLYQAAWTLGGLCVGFVLQSMGTDFYPRLVGVAQDHEACNRLVDEQTRASVLLASAGVLATIALSPVLVSLLYSNQFREAAPALRWICLGMALRVLSWPMGFILVARGERGLFFATELAWTIVNLGLSWWLIQRYGAIGAGIAFFASYVFHLALLYPIVRRRTGFRWSPGTAMVGAGFLTACIAATVAFHFLPTAVAAILGSSIAAAAGCYSMRAFRALLRLPCTVSSGVDEKI